MITLKNLSLSREEKLLFENANLTFQRGWKVGVIGKNGAGKSSLFSLFQGELHPEEGEIILPPDLTLSFVHQEILSPNENALNFVLQGDKKLWGVLEKEKKAHTDLEIAQIHEAMEHLNAYSAKARALQILSGLGFPPEVEHQQISAFSGGWQMRLNLARALFAPADLLLLDEPTNHLDLNAILWLENWLQKNVSTLFIIAHDKHFLNATVNHILSFENKHLHLQHGNYSTYEKTLLARIQTQNALSRKTAQKRAHLEDFIRRFRYKATKAKQAQSRLKMLEKLKVVESLHAELPFSFQFPNTPLPAHHLLKMENIAFHYFDHCVFEKVNLSLESESRIGLLGKNGAGKSTLMKLLAGVLTPSEGTMQTTKNLKIGYFAQQALENLKAEKSALEHLTFLAPHKTPQELRDFLGNFAFSGELALTPVESLSGGEKARLALSLIAFQKPHLLLMDEPTNHLDITMREALTLALQNFNGALVLVSHDRSLLESVCDEFWLVERTIKYWEGDLNDYAQFLSEKPATPKNVKEENKTKRENEKKQRADFLNQKRALQKELNRVDALLTQKNARLDFLNESFLSPDFYQNEQAPLLQKEAQTLQTEIEDLENQWLHLSARLEEFKEKE